MDRVDSIPFDSFTRIVNGRARIPLATARERPAPLSDIEWLPDDAVVQAAADEVWEVFDAPDRAERLNALLARTRLQPRLTLAGDLRWHSPARSVAGILLARFTATTLDAVRLVGWDRLGVCGAADCVDVFIDDGGRAHRRYCSTTCLNRTRVRDHRARGDGR
ncbi:CGNR zinc finger domain-containing protein [Williamsia sterculiae]|nr:CGNR zinc finger domain-containing protein [Williamsia sterculiae]